MMAPTHMLASALATSLILGTADGAILVVSAVSGLLPDIDISTSVAGRVFIWVANWFEKKYPHRSCTHSLVATGVVAVVVYSIVHFLFHGKYLDFAHAITIGYFFGWLIDCFTKSGVEMMWPATERYVCPGNKVYRLRSGSPVEYILLIILVIITILIFKLNANGGILSQFDRFIGSQSGVEDIYNKSGSTHLVKVNIDGIKSSDRSHVNDSFTIIQAENNDFIVLSKDGKLYKAGAGNDCQIIVNQITADVGAVAITNIQSITLQDESVEEKLNQVVKSGLVFVSGELTVDDPEEVTLIQDPYQFAFMHKEEKTIKLQSAPLAIVLKQIGDQFATGQLSIRSIITND